MNASIDLTPAVALLVLALAGCSSSGVKSNGNLPAPASTAACDAALVQQLRTGMESPGATSSKPAACVGVADAELQTLANQAMAQVFATPSP
ncbi:hypothetical protein [Streptacidiphilus sp. MAP12-16]|uniref:hypothetical protein n=1 Tax=Streptacidiphilus sp. MAP12-16 TaxID=3156300 RepID=UPI003515806B